MRLRCIRMQLRICRKLDRPLLLPRNHYKFGFRSYIPAVWSALPGWLSLGQRISIVSAMSGQSTKCAEAFLGHRLQFYMQELG